jgi:hypothetical protein
VEKQRLKEAIWRVQGQVRRGGMATYRRQIVEQELELLATALDVPTLDSFDNCPVCGTRLPIPMPEAAQG